MQPTRIKSARSVLRFLASKYNFPVSKLKSASRSDQITYLRWLFAFSCRHFLHMTKEETGSLLGGLSTRGVKRAISRFTVSLEDSVVWKKTKWNQRHQDLSSIKDFLQLVQDCKDKK